MLTVQCNVCSAPLTVRPGSVFVTCSTCGTALRIVDTGSAIFTEPAGDPSPGSLADRLTTLAAQTELNRLDIEWQREREQYMARGRYGETFVSTRRQALTTIRLAIAVSLGFVLFTASLPGARALGAPIWGGGLLLVLGVAYGIYLYRKASAYERAREAYLRQRAAVQSPRRQDTEDIR